LERDQVIYCIHGRGRFVSADPRRFRDSITQLRSVTEMAHALGFRLTSRVLDVKTRLPMVDEVAALQISEGERVVELERARHAEGDPLIYSVDIFREKLVTGLPDRDAWTGSLVKLMESWGVHLAYSETAIHATLLPLDIAKRLGVDRHLPWILLVQVNYDAERRPRLFSRDYHRGDEFSFQVTRHRFTPGEEEEA
jgi:GntR family transcriptional regulator